MSSEKKTVFVIYYSLYGHVEKLARQICKGLERAGVNAKLFQVAETLSQNELQKMNPSPKAKDVPIITPDLLPQADGFLFGLPTRFGMLPAQMKTFFDSCGDLWNSGALNNKFAGTFVSTGSIGAGQETTAMSTIPFFAHMGLIYVPIGHKSDVIDNMSEIHGGSAWGAGAISGERGSRQCNDLELELAEFQGFDFGYVVKRTNFN
jgi:NAD(P)H dehydrogenase (quinone)